MSLFRTVSVCIKQDTVRVDLLGTVSLSDTCPFLCLLEIIPIKSLLIAFVFFPLVYALLLELPSVLFD